MIFNNSITKIKEVKEDGNSFKIRLDAEDMKVYDLKDGSIIDITIKRVKK